MKTIKFFLKLIFGTLAILVIFNSYILPILKNYGEYLHMSYRQEKAEKMITRGLTSNYCDNLLQKTSKDSHHFCLKNSKLIDAKYYPLPKGNYGVEAFYHGKYKNNVVCELHMGYNGGDPHDPYTCSFVSYDKIQNPNVPFGEAFIYFRTKNRAGKNNK